MMYCLKDMESFDQIVKVLTINLDHYGRVVHNGEWQAKQGTPHDTTIEIEDVSFEWDMPGGLRTLQEMVQPNLPWAEDHFAERVSGRAYNPPPSHEYWPFNQNSNAEHRPDGEKFSHTYPERFWPNVAEREQLPKDEHGLTYPRRGIRFAYGDLNDLIDLLLERPGTRQAFLPIWFPEDLSATRIKERVPCTLGYHFMIRQNKLSCRYYMRSCDFFRHFRDDVYMAARLAQFICDAINTEWVMASGHEDAAPPALKPGKLVMHISSLHIFEKERQALKLRVQNIQNMRASKLQEANWW